LTLTRRGRLALTLGVVLLALAALVGVAALILGPTATPAAASSSTSHAALTTITVRSGETLWSIANRVAPNTDPRETVTALREVNNLDTGYVYAGQRLIVPSTR
jgi:LysM repeat protein